MSPGPSLATVIRNTVFGSRYHGIATGVSHAFGIGVYALLSVTGLVILIREAPIIFRVLTWVGAIYLLWLGWQGVTAKKGLIAQNESQISTLQISSAARDGLAILFAESKNFSLFRRPLQPVCRSGHQSLEFLHHGRHPNADRRSLVQPDYHFCFSKIPSQPTSQIRGLGGPCYRNPPDSDCSSCFFQ